ncbi:MAG: DNA alkylation repair protein [Acidimicrobiales bacterium]
MGAADFAWDVVARLRAAFEPVADAEHAAGAAAYMRNQFGFFGISTPERRRVTRAALAGLPAPDEQQLAAVARALWAEPERELQYVGSDYVRRHVHVASAAFIDVVHELVTTKSWWDTVDALAPHTAGALVRAHPELLATMDRWIESDDFWVARTAILHQLAAKDATDAERLFRYCRLRASDEERFIRKAIGWALRTHAARDADAVEQFLTATPDLSGLSVREAMKGVTRARR